MSSEIAVPALSLVVLVGAMFVGDLVDRGPDVAGVLRLVMGMVAAGSAVTVMGNHEAKLLRALRAAPPPVPCTPGRAGRSSGQS